jgi:hypothetical protein
VKVAIMIGISVAAGLVLIAAIVPGTTGLWMTGAGVCLALAALIGDFSKLQLHPFAAPVERRENCAV